MTGKLEATADATTLALERTRVAYERTAMAWIRTGTSLITFGFSVYKFFQLEMSARTAGLVGPRGFGLTLIGIGLLALLLGTLEHRRDLAALQEHYPDMPRSSTLRVAALLAALGCLAFFVVITRG